MTQGLLHRAEEVFLEVIGLPPGERAAVLDRLCNGDDTLRAEVLSFLEHHEGTDAFLRTSDAHRAFEAGPLLPSTRIGEFTVLGVLGTGGMGMVYRAEQERPRRIVALKLMRQAPFASGSLRRFESEAELLGRLQHPGIAQIFGAGVAQVGFGPQPYFAMELIDGPSIAEYASRHRLSLHDRLGLMLKVCAAAEHAHTKGVIHRDLKPANILVGADGEPKIVDFGIARAVGADLDRDAFNTRAGELLGTLSYMSPEQVAGDPGDVDTRADVYALGAVMYQLLCGRPARDLSSVPLEQALRAIREEDPPRLGTVDAGLRGDIEVIVARAMSRDRDRRYQSAAELGDEIRRSLAGEPIEARRDSAVYVLGRRIRRYRVWFAGAAVTLLGLASFAVYAWTQSVHQASLATKASEAKADAQSALERAQREAEALRRSDYFNRIGFAQAALAEGDSARMTRLLDACPDDLRGWEWSYLKRLSDRSTARIQARRQGMGSMAAAVGAGKLVTYRIGEEALIWDIRTRTMLGRLSPEGGAFATACTPDGRSWATLSRTGVQIWDSTGSEVRRWDLTPGGGAVEIDADGKRVLVLGPAGLTRVFDATGQLISEGRIAAPLLCAQFSPDGARIACGDSAGRITLLDTASGAQLSAADAHGGAVRSLAFSTDGKSLASGGEDGTARVWNVTPGRPITGWLWFRTHTNKATATAISPSGEFLASGSSDTTIKVLSLKDGKEFGTLTGHTATICRVQFLSESEVVSTALDGTVRWWDLSRMEEDPHVKTDLSIVGAAFETARNSIIIAGSSGIIREHSAESLALVREVATCPDPITRVAAASDGVVTTDVAGTVRWWPFDKGSDGRVIARHSQTAMDVALCSTRGWAASVGMDGYLRVVGVATGSPVHEVLAHPGGATAVATSVSGDLIVTGGTDRKVRVWDAATWSSRSELTGHTDSVWSILVSKDGRTILTTGEDGSIFAFPAAGGAGRSFVGHHGPVYCAAVSPDGARLVTGGFDNTLRVWDLPSGVELLTLRNHIGSVRGAAFSRDGATVLSASDDGIVRLWRSEAADTPSRTGIAP